MLMIGCVCISWPTNPFAPFALAGEVGIDDALVMETKEEIYEMNNGCVCCTGEVVSSHSTTHLQQ
jgi:hypothetical protein